MGRKPKVIYTGNDGALTSNLIQHYLADENIKQIITRAHAGVAERQIRTIKNHLDQRIEHNPKPWTVYLPSILRRYNNKEIHRTIGMTPNEARQPRNEHAVKTALVLHKIHQRKYPEINIGDTVKMFRKKDKMDKERIPVWDPKKRKVLDIQEVQGQQLYKVEDWPNLLIRSDLLLIR